MFNVNSNTNLPQVLSIQNSLGKSVPTATFNINTLTTPEIPISYLRTNVQVNGNPTGNVIITLPSNKDLLTLFDNPQVGNIITLLVKNNLTNNSIRFSVNSGDPTNTIDKGSIGVLFMVVAKTIDNTLIVNRGVFDYEAKPTLQNGVNVNVININTGNPIVLQPEWITGLVDSTRTQEIYITSGVGSGNIIFKDETTHTGITNFLNGLVTPVISGSGFSLTFRVINNSLNQIWNSSGTSVFTYNLTNNSLITQTHGETYEVVMQFNVLGSSPDWSGSTCNVGLTRVA